MDDERTTAHPQAIKMNSISHFSYIHFNRPLSARGPWCREGLGISSHQTSLDHFNEKQIDHYHHRQEEEVKERQRRESERTRKGRVREQDANRDNQEGRDREWATGATAQRIARRTNTKQDKCLRRERFDEPPGMEEHRVRLEDP